MVVKKGVGSSEETTPKRRNEYVSHMLKKRSRLSLYLSSKCSERAHSKGLENRSKHLHSVIAVTHSPERSRPGFIQPLPSQLTASLKQTGISQAVR